MYAKMNEQSIVIAIIPIIFAPLCSIWTSALAISLSVQMNSINLFKTREVHVMIIGISYSLPDTKVGVSPGRKVINFLKFFNIVLAMWDT